jgi:hypothetical protein
VSHYVSKHINRKLSTLVLSNDLLGAGIRHGLVPEKQLNAVFAHLANARHPVFLAPKTEFSNQRSKSGSAYE